MAGAFDVPLAVSIVGTLSSVVTSICALFADECFLLDTSIAGEQFKNSWETGMLKISGTMYDLSQAWSGDRPGM